MNAQGGNPDWDTNVLLGESQYEGNAKQIGFPVGVYAQVAMAAQCAWNQLPTKGDLRGSLASIKHAPGELFQDLVDRLLKSANRIFGDSQAENLQHYWLMSMLMQLVTTPLDLTRDSRVYSPFCRDWAFIQSMSSHGCSFARNHRTGDNFTETKEQNVF